MDESIGARLRNVYWIGGGSGAGKSTVARELAARFRMTVYSTDDAMADHVGRSSAVDAPCLEAFKAMDMDERWVNRSPEVMLETFHWFRGEGFGLIVEDLLRMPAEAGVVVEGFRLLPRLVEPLLAERRRAVWLLPTPGFRRAAFDSRGTTWDIARRTSDPVRALDNRLARDGMFTERLRAEVDRLGLPAVEVGAGTGAGGLAERVARMLGLAGTTPPGPG